MPKVLSNESLVNVLVKWFRCHVAPAAFASICFEGGYPARKPCLKHWVVRNGSRFDHGADYGVGEGGAVVCIDPCVYHVHLGTKECAVDAVLRGEMDVGLEVGVFGHDVRDLHLGVGACCVSVKVHLYTVLSDVEIVVVDATCSRLITVVQHLMRSSAVLRKIP